jgi:hypothetical protein
MSWNGGGHRIISILMRYNGGGRTYANEIFTLYVTCILHWMHDLDHCYILPVAFIGCGLKSGPSLSSFIALLAAPT